jgi:hypothetical protein
MVHCLSSCRPFSQALYFTSHPNAQSTMRSEHSVLTCRSMALCSSTLPHRAHGYLSKGTESQGRCQAPGGATVFGKADKPGGGEHAHVHRRGAMMGAPMGDGEA